MKERSYGFGVSGVFGAEHRCLVRLCGETQRLLEQLKSKVSADLCFSASCMFGRLQCSV